MARGNEKVANQFETDLEWCYEAVQGVSRTFALTVERLREPMARRICVGYLLCRVPDTVEDATHIPAADQAELLETYERVLDPEDPTEVATFREEVDRWLPDPGDRSDDWDVVASAPRIVRTFENLDPTARELMRPPVRELTDGMATFVRRYADEGGLRIETIDELESYCWYVAGTVGRLVTDLSYRSASREVPSDVRDDARAFALLLQLVNVAKDVADDYREENNVYLPAEWLRDEGLDPDDVARDENATAVARVVDRVVDRASGYLDGALDWIGAMPTAGGNTLDAWALPYLLAVATIRELRDRPEEVVQEGDVAVSRAEVYELLERFDGDRTFEDVRHLRKRIESEPLS